MGYLAMERGSNRWKVGSMGYLAIDPGAVTGWALFSSPMGTLLRAGYLSRDEALSHPPELHTANGSWHVCIELPQVYRKERQHKRVDPNDLINLAVMVGDLRGQYRSRGAQVELVLPAQWKGQVSKEIHNARTFGKLTDEERKRLPKKPRATKNLYDHNMLDAVGLGLWAIGRTPR